MDVKKEEGMGSERKWGGDQMEGKTKKHEGEEKWT